jgi:hypothetical protein
MASKGKPPYRVDPTGPFKEQMHDLLAKAAAHGQRQKVVRALKAIARELQTRPLDWGDPERRTRKKGGHVYHGIKPPLVVQYAVYEPKKVVWLLNVRAIPGSPLAE